ncbi:hypothetical protein [Rhodanobacter sp. OK091]|uniref:hypothetical protein n=1 Tax=Rhodanobacter sp. OK091 TaxID=1881037 RepID=UPI000921D066|nr:hypothetical protein [Rhodanobacter sp. OK091]SHL78874.1 hypothetical protein SAMN05428972_1229 [Rhodanobacter sp. OK091]
MSLIALAEAIDGLVETKQAFVAESENAVTVSALSAAHASELKALCEPLGWPVELFDRVGEPWVSAEAPDPGFAPYRLVIQKPASPANTLRLLSNHAFAEWLEIGHVAPRWHIARFTGSLVTGVRVIQSWEGAQEPAALPSTKSPRALVKEFGNVRRVPEDVRYWLAPALDSELFIEPAAQVWIRAASAALISCLPDEIDADNGALKFRGPPRLTLPRFDVVSDVLDHASFNTLMEVSYWLFEHEREAEMRHILLAAELARSGATAESTPTFLRQHLAHAWESAQIAYQMALSETGLDTLKVLSDLRKAVTEETAKLSDISRQLTGSVAAALATGIGLIAARVAANAPAELIAIVMLVVALYITMVISSGVQFMRLQRQLRTDWQHRLYRFLPEAEYTRMVVKPTGKAERSFVWTAWLGGVAVAVLTLACGWAVLAPTSATPTSTDVPAQSAIPFVPPPSPATDTVSATPAKPTTATVVPAPTKDSSKASPTSPPRK